MSLCRSRSWLAASAYGPVESVDDMVRPGLFEPDEEWQESLADLDAFRRSGLA